MISFIFYVAIMLRCAHAYNDPHSIHTVQIDKSIECVYIGGAARVSLGWAAPEQWSELSDEAYSDDCYIIYYEFIDSRTMLRLPVKCSYAPPTVWVADIDANGSCELAVIYSTGRGTCVTQKSVALYVIDDSFEKIFDTTLSSCDVLKTSRGSGAEVHWERSCELVPISASNRYELRISSRKVFVDDTENVVVDGSLFELLHCPGMTVRLSDGKAVIGVGHD